ncbi:MAG: SH3 domain-containing protein [Caldilineales bacterium]|nr:SH3 domain-containing protein [Caldilineales bacterium]
MAPLLLLALVTLACGSFAPRPTPVPRPTATPTEPAALAAGEASTPTPTSALPTSVPTRAVPTPTFTPTPVPGTVLIVGQPARITAPGGLNVRRAPSVKGDRIGRFQANERVIVLEGPVEADGYRWWRVGTNQLAGWVAEGSGDEVWLSPQVSDRRPVRRAVRLGDDVIVTIGEGGFLKVRSQPGLGGVVQFKLDPSTQLTVIDGPVEADNYRWWKVTDGQDVTGWAAEGDNSERWLTPLE